tara:strand:- start:196 stop:462 length:267 start_codon:yes stop_codon:yes gene_type:complete
VERVGLVSLLQLLVRLLAVPVAVGVLRPLPQRERQRTAGGLARLSILRQPLVQLILAVGVVAVGVALLQRNPVLGARALSFLLYPSKR